MAGSYRFLLALTSIFWRESWKYGERAFRYCNHDVGHALAGLSVSAGIQGWRLALLNGLSDGDIEAALGFDRTQWEPLEEEHVELLGWVRAGKDKRVSPSLPEELIDRLSGLPVKGRPNRLSNRRVDWQVIGDVAAKTRKPRTEEQSPALGKRPFLGAAASPFSAVEIIRKRRSAVEFDPDGTLPRDRFFAILDKTLPRRGCPPFDAGLSPPWVHLLLFVHNVEQLARGIYFLFRNSEDTDAVKSALDKEFIWKPLCDQLPLYLLREGDFRRQAARVSCHQEIAGNGCFSLGMVARFQERILPAPYRYRRLFWETGMIGQVLYLEAEAQGVRGTGIGCYFDDAVHDLMGLKDMAWQSLYHFTIGHSIEDRRLAILPPYHHLQPADRHE